METLIIVIVAEEIGCPFDKDPHPITIWDR
jgi:hypothetical protein